jgi:glycosyltransferase 2 family protein
MTQFRFWLGIIISATALFWAMHGIPLAEIWLGVRNVNYVTLLPISLLILMDLWGKGARWEIILGDIPNLRKTQCFSIISIGYLVNNLFPLRAGDFVRAFLLGKKTGAGTARVLPSILIERALDLTTILLLLVGTLPFLPVLPSNLRRRVMVLGALLLAVIIVVVILTSSERFRYTLLGILQRWRFLEAKTRVVNKTESVLEGFAAFRSPWAICKAFGWSFSSWLCASMLAYAMFFPFGIRLPFSAALLVVCMTSLGAAIPSSPGFVGVYHSLVVLALGVYFIDKGQAMSYALVLHGWQYILQSLLGGISIWAENISYAEIGRVEAEGKA